MRARQVDILHFLRFLVDERDGHEVRRHEPRHRRTHGHEELLALQRHRIDGLAGLIQRDKLLPAAFQFGRTCRDEFLHLLAVAAQFGLLALALGDIADDAEGVADGAVGVAQRRHRAQPPHDAAILAQIAVLVLKEIARPVQHLLEEQARAGTILGDKQFALARAG